jgi:hypothetical protein
LKTFLKILAWITGLLLFLVLLLLAPVKHEDYQEQPYYRETMQRIEELEFTVSDAPFWLAGWSSQNVTPDQPVDLVGYKPRGNYEFVLDSSYVKALVLGDGNQQVAFLNYELLIVHPHLAGEVKKAINEANLGITKVVFTATHTHSGMGGYIPGLMGKIAFGGYDGEVMDLLVERSIKGIREAVNQMDTVDITYRQTAAREGVTNRLTPDGPVDPYFRQLVFEKRNGETGTFITYSAHSTGLHSQFMGLSGDYPYFLTKALEEEHGFAMFAAGAVGSHAPVLEGREPEHIKSYANNLSKSLEEENEEMPVTTSLKLANLPLSLPEAQYRISDQVRLRPWVHNNLFGDTNAHFDVIVIGNTLLISSSGEVSGVFYEDWEKLALQLNLNLIITTFNGGYTGYIVPDEHYDMKHHETRDMNWFGPTAGSYFDEVIKALIIKSSWQ